MGISNAEIPKSSAGLVEQLVRYLEEPLGASLAGSELGKALYMMADAAPNDGYALGRLNRAFGRVIEKAEGEKKVALEEARMRVASFIGTHGTLEENDPGTAKETGLYRIPDHMQEMTALRKRLGELLRPVYEVNTYLDTRTETLQAGDDKVGLEHAYAGWRHDVMQNVAWAFNVLVHPDHSYEPTAMRIVSAQERLAALVGEIDAQNASWWKNPETDEMEQVIPDYRTHVPETMLKEAKEALNAVKQEIDKTLQEAYPNTVRFRYLDKPQPTREVSDVRTQSTGPDQGIRR